MRRMGLNGNSAVAVLSCVLLLGGATAARQSDGLAALNEHIRRIFGTAEFAAPRFGPARWLADGRAYTTVERAAQSTDIWDIVRYDAATGARSILIAGSRLTPSGRTTPLALDDYAWSVDGRQLLLFTNTRRVWRQNTRGDYWVFDVAGGTLQQVGRGAPESSLMFAKFSPDGTRVGYVRANNVYVERLADGQVSQLTRDGSDTTINGTSDWVYEEELGVRDGFRWSPDGKRIAYWQFDSTGVEIFSLINNTDTLYPVITRIPYPKAGTQNSAVRIGVVDVDTAVTRWMKTPGHPRDTYLARLDWIDAQTIAMQQLNRLQNQNDFLFGDAATGEVRRAFRDESKTWVEVMDEVPWIDKGRAFLWLSERDGWQHIYRVPREGGAGKLITRFDADVTDYVGVDESGGWVYFLASPANATQRYLYRSRLDGSGTPQRVTPSAAEGSHSYVADPSGRLAFHTFSRFEQPPQVDVVELATHRSLRTLTDPSELAAKVAPLLKPAAEFFSMDIGEGVTLDGYMIKPASFDAARSYPVIVHVYGEPASQTVVDRWGGTGMLFRRALANAGYVVVSFDNRGTPAPKGAAWRKIIYGTVGDLSSKDQAAAVGALAARHAFIDRERVGVWGASGGGSNTLNAMFRFPDVFKVGVSVAPVPDQRLYDTIYQERYMGLPSTNAEGYRIGSPINFAEGLQGKLLLIHGTGDDNVHYQGTERLINRLVELGKPFDLMSYPNRTHALSEGRGTSTHLNQRIARFFLENLPAGPR
jgi:dipeptidyl-peptidase-4